MSRSPQEKARAFADAACHYAEATAVLCAAADALDQARTLYDEARNAMLREARPSETLHPMHATDMITAHTEYLVDAAEAAEREAAEEAGF